ncbi:rRNA maturation RNase YbeY [Buchnera aphidicola]|uniref:rRNA maturation RNase YbeY n=1 Tax=Buchnera aphidicola TaxID=9 RepID=UPI003464D976
MLKLNIKYSCKNKKNIPTKKIIKKWIKKITKKSINYIFTINVVNKKKMIKLNFLYKKKKKETNILSFPIINILNENEKLILGDLVICKSVLEKESKKYKFKIKEYWARIIIHGILHLTGYQHNNFLNRKNMEKKEIQTMKSFGFKNPYYI